MNFRTDVNVNGSINVGYLPGESQIGHGAALTARLAAPRNEASAPALRACAPTRHNTIPRARGRMAQRHAMKKLAQSWRVPGGIFA